VCSDSTSERRPLQTVQTPTRNKSQLGISVKPLGQNAYVAGHLDFDLGVLLCLTILEGRKSVRFAGRDHFLPKAKSKNRKKQLDFHGAKQKRFSASGLLPPEYVQKQFLSQHDFRYGRIHGDEICRDACLHRICQPCSIHTCY
jgi:hypothetical protein